MKKSDLKDRLRGIYRVPITDGLGPAGGEEPDNPNEFVRSFEVTPIQNEAAAEIERLEKLLSKATRFSFGIGRDRRPEIYVETRGPGKWAVTDGFNSCYNAFDEWEHEPTPSNRDESFIERTRYSFDQAVWIAEKLVS